VNRRRRSAVLLRGLIGSLTAAALLAGCASPRALMRDMQTLITQEQYPAAAELVKNAKTSHYGAKNAFLYYADLGMTLHLAGKYAESNAAFESAKKIATDLFTKSVSKEAATFLTSDNARPYAGEDFERALIHVFCALNYVFLGEENEALVEARQADFLLTKLQTDYGHKNVYTEDAFIHYLSGMVYENAGETNDAFIAYRKALDAYVRYRKDYGTAEPPALIQAALRTAAKLGFTDEVREIKNRWGGTVPGTPPTGDGEVVVFHYNGLAPYKTDSFFEIGFIAGWAYVEAENPQGEDREKMEQAGAAVRSLLADDVVRVAFPKYVRQPYAVKSLEVRAAEANASHSANLAEDIGAIAIKNLQDRIGRVRTKAIARSVLKFALSRKIAAEVEEKRGAGAAWLTKKILQVASSATELADKRCWQTLPDQIGVASLTLPAGKHTLTLTFRDAAGNTVLTREMKDVDVRPGKKTFLTIRTAH